MSSNFWKLISHDQHGRIDAGSMLEMAKVEGNTHQNHFIHKGKTGSWMKFFDHKNSKQIEEWERKYIF